jgi:hypothetical protein
MLYGQDHNQFNYQPEPENEPGLTWLDYIILTNPQGVMKVLASKGYTGYLAPQDEEEMMDCCLELMDKEGDQAVVDLIKSHPLYEVIAEISQEDVGLKNPFRSATGDSVIATIKTIDYKKLIENVLIIVGAFYLAGKLWSYFTKSDA